MPPRTVCSKDAVIEAGFDVLRRQGLKQLTARNVAERLGASVAPVYRWFPSMEAFEGELVERVTGLLLEYAGRAYTELRFLDMGVGIARFAREEPGLFRAMFLERSDFKHLIDEILASLCEQMREDEMFADMPDGERMALLTKMWVYTHGLASLICVGVLDEDDDDFIIASLRGVGTPVSREAIADFERRHGAAGGTNATEK